MLEVIGIHSNVTGDAGLTDGHAWLSMQFTNGKHTTVGLWTTTLFESRRMSKDPTGVILDESFDVNFGLEEQKNYQPAASRYYKLSEAQAKRAVAIMGSYTGWRFTNTCASWATKVVRELLGEELASSELGGLTQTPRALGQAILQLEARDPTSVTNPKKIITNPVVKGSLAQWQTDQPLTPDLWCSTGGIEGGQLSGGDRHCEGSFGGPVKFATRCPSAAWFEWPDATHSGSSRRSAIGRLNLLR